MRRFIRFAMVFFALFILSLYPPEHASAEDRSYYVSGYNIDVNVNPDGSADFQEELTYSFSGSFNGILRNVDFSLSGGIEEQKVYAMSGGNLTEFTRNRTDSLDYDGKPGTYNIAIEGSTARFKIFEPSQDEEKTFVIRYRMKDAVTVYNDTAEFNRKLVGSEWETSLQNVYARITLPEGAEKEELKVFAHGPLTGESKITDGRTLVFTAPLLSPGQMMETLVLFPVALVPSSNNRIAQDALPRIMENERIYAEEANREREDAREQVRENERREAEIRAREFEQRQAEEQARRSLSAVGLPLALLLFVLWFPLIVYIYIKYDRELKHGFEGKYYRELPGDYTPAEMTVLMTMGSVNSRDIMATLMDLVRKKQLLLTASKTVKKGFFANKEIDDYVISVNDQAPPAMLKKHEEFLISWFAGSIGDGSSVHLEEIKEYVSSRSNALQFKSDYDKWVGLVKNEADKNEFFDTTSGTGRLIGILSGLGFTGAGIAIAAAMFVPFAVALALEGVFMLIFSVRIGRRTAYGSEQHAMWQAFKNFLKDFSRLDKAVIPSIVLWEHYLVYAISLGVAKEVIRQLPIVFNDGDLDNSQLTFMHGAAFGYFSGFSTVFDNTMSAVESSISSAVSIASSTDSSSSGSGGGFSGGSSGGGGGGGGGGAF